MWVPLRFWLEGQEEGRGDVKRSPRLSLPDRHACMPPSPVEISPRGPSVAPAGDSESGSAGRRPPPEPAEPVCGVSASEDSVCLPSCKPTSVCPCFTESGLFGALNEALLQPPPLPPWFFSQPQALGGGFLWAFETCL